ncbi:hypothetical protein KC363_g3474 [Hortaea werneckii]|uniref:MARVEL domain-containing protein n=1 Tax=Hortaea werneckii TaxID=91943 RepID=A0A3M7FLK4_HORWE|nr:hypothetical protein KC361_g1843 [Hortaea werneckii]KAI6885108.1 hypothetical protein KC325_g3789 [Hortaea werneckii]KAI6998052.1 hypothetical protein KC359_g2599 [Hortaea werneckii]KAI7146314.1 hypothetical protein KC344_g3755 [Hortaea werneckii]KAI7178478.1 hypothetical protein KC360_g1538 [Hortaea werneckii]
MDSSLVLFLQLALAMLTFAAPVANEPTVSAQSDAWQYGTGGGIVGFIVLVLDVIVWMEVLQSNRPVSHKVLCFFFEDAGGMSAAAADLVAVPIVGIIVYWLFSNREAHKPNAGYEPIG